MCNIPSASDVASTGRNERRVLDTAGTHRHFFGHLFQRRRAAREACPRRLRSAVSAEVAGARAWVPRRRFPPMVVDIVLLRRQRACWVVWVGPPRRVHVLKPPGLGWYPAAAAAPMMAFRRRLLASRQPSFEDRRQHHRLPVALSSR